MNRESVVLGEEALSQYLDRNPLPDESTPGLGYEIRATKNESSADLYKSASFIRGFENSLFALHKQGLISGTVHTCIGQETIPVALHEHLCPGKDAFFATHRGHGHFLAYGGEPRSLLAEMMGRAGAVCHGRGGSQHLCFERFFSNGIQGAGSLQAVGFAWMQKLLGEEGMTVAQLGDGTLGEGAVYEALNFAALLRVPILFLIEYNGWAQSTDVRNTIAGTIEGRAAAFGLSFDRRGDSDIEALKEHFGHVIERVRAGQPWVQVVETRRLVAHSKGDDNRPPELIDALHAADPLAAWERAHPDEAEAVRVYVNECLADCISDISTRSALSELDGSALPPLADVPGSEAFCAATTQDGHSFGRIVEELNHALHRLMTENSRVVMLGEDIADPYGGAFKVTQGLSGAFGPRVFSTPIAENAIAGLATGAALGGLRPVAEIMFADFVTLAADQLINSAAKFHYMFGGKVTCPLTLRLVSGGGRGYGPTHSQSPERLFCGEPGLRVVALSRRHDPGALLRHVVLHDDAPTVFVENKGLYGQKPLTELPLGMRFHPAGATQETYPPLVFVPDGASPSVTIVCYGDMAEWGEKALEKLLLEHELYGDLIVLTQLWPLDPAAIIESLSRTRHLLVIEPHVPTYGIGAAVTALAAEALNTGFRVRTVGARPYPIPSARTLEDQVLPALHDVEKSLYQLLRIS
jgi:2-oxoisovalerate dehydrogenase E1 component